MKPIKSSSEHLNNKRAFYIKQMHELDAGNNEILTIINRMEKTLGKLRAQLNDGRMKREKARRKISRYKQAIKNKNRDDNGSAII